MYVNEVNNGVVGTEEGVKEREAGPKVARGAGTTGSHLRWAVS